MCKFFFFAVIFDFLILRFFFRRVRTLYACLAENDGELSFEPNQIITNGECFIIFFDLNLSCNIDEITGNNRISQRRPLFGTRSSGLDLLHEVWPSSTVFYRLLFSKETII